MRRRLLLAILVGSGLCGIFEPVGSSAAARASAVPECKDEVFTFQVNFWVNLHLFLRSEARRRDSNLAPRLPPDLLPGPERGRWNASIEAYRAMGQKSVFDADVVGITNALSQVRGASRVGAAGLPPAVLAALNGASASYLRRLWPEDQRQGNLWIRDHCAAIQRLDLPMRAAIAGAFGVAEPKAPILVDLAGETGPNLAFTTVGSAGLAGHTVLAPEKVGPDLLALTTMFHEISHTMDDDVTRIVAQEASNQGITPPEYLWHAMTLYTTSVLTEKAVASDRVWTSSIDADRLALFERSHWDVELAALNEHWRPYLDGRVERLPALRAVIRAVNDAHSAAR